MPCNLMLHCGAAAVPRSALGLTPTPPSTRTWHPIPHESFVQQMENLLPAYGLGIVGEAHALTHDSSRYFGLIEVQGGCSHPDYTWVLGLRNSHDQSLPAGLVAGSQVFVCDNLAFSGEIKVTRKHTRHILRDLPELMGNAIGRLVESWQFQDHRIDAYKNCPVSDRSAHDLMIRAMDQEVLPASRLPKTLKVWREPSHDAFEPRNVWSLFNAFTESLKGQLHLLPGRTRKLHALCDRFAGV